MSTEPVADRLGEDEAIEIYRIVCFAAAGAMGFVLFATGSSLVETAPAIVGAICLIWVFSSGAIITLLTLAAIMQMRGLFAGDSVNMQDRLIDLVVTTAALVYVVGYYRLRSLKVQIFPDDPRLQKKPRKKRPQPQKRFAGLVTRNEIGAMVLAAPLWAALAAGCWMLFAWKLGDRDTLPFWRVIRFVWIVGMLLLVPGAVVGYLARRAMGRREALLFLQDVLWNETRREQRRIDRWLSWARMRRLRGDDAARHRRRLKTQA
jgi:hypothetical protein